MNDAAGRSRPSRRVRARLVGLSAGLLAVLVGASSAAAALSGFAWPSQSEGNRGWDVKAIQLLLRSHGVRVSYAEAFTADMKRAVVEFQAAKGLAQTGVVDAATWPKLVRKVAAGSSGAAVLALERQLKQKHRASLVADGVWDSATTTAVRAFEKHVGLPVDGIADPTMWRYLIAHFDLPVFSSAGLCDYSVGNGAANWGTGAAIGQTEAAGRAMVAAGYGRVAVGDISYQHGGDIPLHSTHERGLDVDLRPMRKNRDQCTWGTNYRYTSYDRAATRALIKAIRSTAPGHVKLIYFNDPVLIGEGLTTWYSGHDDHLHVRYCEASHPVAAYRC